MLIALMKFALKFLALILKLFNLRFIYEFKLRDSNI